MTLKLGILASGSGTNAQAMIDAAEAGRLVADIRIIIANRPGAPVLDRAERHGIAHLCLDHKTFPDRETFDRRMVEELTAAGVDTVALAGYMRLVTPVFLDAFPGRVLNIHPAVLPASPARTARATPGSTAPSSAAAPFTSWIPSWTAGPSSFRPRFPCVRTKTTKRCSIAFTCSSTASTCRLCSGWPKTVCASTAAACSLSRRAVRSSAAGTRPDLAAAGRRFLTLFAGAPGSHRAGAAAPTRLTFSRGRLHESSSFFCRIGPARLPVHELRRLCGRRAPRKAERPHPRRCGI